MRIQLPRAAVAAAILCQTSFLFGVYAPSAFAETATQSAPATVEATTETDAEQIALSDKQIEGFIAAASAINAIVDKIPESQRDAPDPTTEAALDKAARSFGFKDFGELDIVSGNISFIVDGFDRETKTFVGHETILKSQIAVISADRKISAREKDAAIKEIKAALATIEPVKFPSNIALVTKYYGRLIEMFPDDE